MFANDEETKRRIAAKEARILALARLVLPQIREEMKKIRVCDHKVEYGKIGLSYERAGVVVATGVGSSIATSGSGLCKTFFWANGFGSTFSDPNHPTPSWDDKKAAIEAVARLKDPELEVELTRLRTEARLRIRTHTSDLKDSKREQACKELRYLIATCSNKFGLSRDDLVDLFEEELRLLRVEAVNAS